MSDDRCYSSCHGCVFYDGGDGGYGQECNVQNEGFEKRVDAAKRYLKQLPCYDFRDIEDMWEMLEADDSIVRT